MIPMLFFREVYVELLNLFLSGDTPYGLPSSPPVPLQQCHWTPYADIGFMTY